MPKTNAKKEVKTEAEEVKQTKSQSQKIEKNHSVKLHYKGTLDQEVPKEAFGPKFAEIKEGQFLGIRSPDGHVMQAKVVKVTAEKATLDLNHPLAGQRLTFNINIVDSKKLSKEEIDSLSHHHHDGDSCGCGDDEEHDHCSGGCC